MAAPALGRTTASWNVNYLIDYAARCGLAKEAVVGRFELDPAALDDVDGRVPLTTLVRMWDELPALTGDPDMPLHVLAESAITDAPLPMLIFLSSPTLGDAFRRLSRYERVNFDLADRPLSEIVLEGDRAHLVLHHERSAVNPPTGAVIDAFLGLLTLARLATKQDIVPLAVALRHLLPARPGSYREAFRCPVEFGAERDRLSLRGEDLALPHPEASRALRAIAEQHAELALERLAPGDDFLGRVRSAIRARLPDGPIALSGLAVELGVGARTLQRRLTAHGTSLRRLVDEERRALALRLIENPRTSLVEIAFALGFAEHSVFTRAFTRWTSRSPRSYRAALR